MLAPYRDYHWSRQSGILRTELAAVLSKVNSVTSQFTTSFSELHGYPFNFLLIADPEDLIPVVIISSNVFKIRQNGSR